VVWSGQVRRLLLGDVVDADSGRAEHPAARALNVRLPHAL